MNASQDPWFVAVVLTVAGVALLLAPLMRYVSKGWAAKRKDIMDALDASARTAYFEKFAPNQPAGPLDFEKFYDGWYGRWHFAFPGILFAAIGTMSVLAIVLTGLHRLGYMKNPFVDLPGTAMAALAGGYLWTLNDQIARARSLDFSPTDVHWGTLRLVIAIPMGYAFASLAPGVAPFVAFGLGAFPLSALIAMLRNVSEKRLGLGPTADEASDSIDRLQGINRPIVQRLAFEDISTVVQLAYCDPVRVVMRSNLSFNFVTDVMNQALAWIYFQEAMDTLRPLGLRGGVEIRTLIVDLDNPGTTPQEQEDHALAVAAFPKIAAALKQDPDTLQIALRQIADDPFTIFLCKVWK